MHPGRGLVVTMDEEEEEVVWCWAVLVVVWMIFKMCLITIENWFWTKRQMDKQTDRPTDGQTDTRVGKGIQTG